MTKEEILTLIDKAIDSGFGLAGEDESDGYFKGILISVWAIVRTLLEEENE